MLVPKKSLGQHFLRDANIARKIAASLRLSKEDVVMEIGPGTGALTQHLAGKTRALIGIELDRRAATLLRSTFGEAVRVVEADVLAVDFRQLATEYRQRLRVVGNIPYYITSEILFRLFEQHEAIEDATLMMQHEVAQRLVAAPKTKAYGILSVASAFYSTPKVLFTVSRNAFYPKPNVDSSVVQLTFRRRLPVCNEEVFRKAVRATFGKRRKTLRNGLRYLGYSEEFLSGIEFNLGRRPEELTLEEFVELTRLLERREPRWNT